MFLTGVKIRAMYGSLANPEHGKPEGRSDRAQKTKRPYRSLPSLPEDFFVALMPRCRHH